MRPTHLSDGSIRFICLATALLQPDPPSTVIIDEPELGLHPSAIPILAELIQSAAIRAQVVIATQSPALIDQFGVDDIVVANRQDGATVFERLKENDFTCWLEEYSLGDLWCKKRDPGWPLLMSSAPIHVMVIVEGRTELLFVSKVLAPHLASRGVYLAPVQVSKPGQKGGDVKFSRMHRDVGSFLKQRADTYVTTCVDFYGIGNDWPGLAEAKLQSNPANRAMTLNDATKVRIVDSYAELRASSRFIPHVSMYEFESLLFSDPQILADRLVRISSDIVEDVINKCGEPEKYQWLTSIGSI